MHPNPLNLSLGQHHRQSRYSTSALSSTLIPPSVPPTIIGSQVQAEIEEWGFNDDFGLTATLAASEGLRHIRFRVKKKKWTLVWEMVSVHIHYLHIRRSVSKYKGMDAYCQAIHAGLDM
jgi:hypothetical protein